MKRLFEIILLCSSLLSCQVLKQEESNRSNSVQLDSAEQSVSPVAAKLEQEEESIFVKDSADYSAAFLKELKASGMKDLSLVDSFLILGPRDTVSFPQIPKISQMTVFTARKGDLAIALTVERINQTTIDYKVEMVEFGKARHISKGKADLNIGFYFGAETDENTRTGTSYLSTQFIDQNDSCYTFIRIGSEDESNRYLLGRLIKNCNGKIIDIGLDNFPTLIEK